VSCGASGRGAWPRSIWPTTCATGEVAVKLLDHGGGDDDGHMRQRFEREFRACSRLSHPNVVRLYSCGVLPDGGGSYYAMEYLDGGDLQDLVMTGAVMPHERALDFARQMARALKQIHGASIVHRDLKPANVMLADGGCRFVVTDFGLARDLARTQLTKTGSVLGSPLYMSPELAHGEKVDGRSDIFQLGVILYEVLTGTRPFDGETLQQLLIRILRHDPAPVTSLAASLPAGWDVVVDGCLAKDAALRYQTCDDLLDDLDRLGRSGRARGPAGRSRSVAVAAAAGGTAALEPVAVTGPTATGAAARGDDARMGRGPSPVAGRPLLRLGMGLVFGGVVLSLGWLASEVRQPVQYGVQDLVCRGEVTSLTVTWRSVRAYPSVVRVQGGRTTRVVEAPERGATTDHRVVVDGCSEDESYQVRVLYPSGETSLPQTVATERLRVEVLEARQQGEGMTVEVGANGTGRLDLVVETADGLRTSVPATASSTGRWTAALPVVPPETTGLTAEVTFEGGERRSVPLGRGLGDEVRRAAGKLSTFDPEAAMRDAVLVYAPDPDRLVNTLDTGTERVSEERRIAREKGRKLRAGLDERLAATGLVAVDERMRQVAPLVLGTRLLPLRLRDELHAGLQRLQAFVVAAALTEARLEGYAYRPVPGAFELSCRPLAGGASRTVPVLRPDEGAEFVRMGMYNKLFELHDNVARRECRFDVVGLGRVRSAELRIRTKARFRCIALRLRLNDLSPRLVADVRQWCADEATFPPDAFLDQRVPVEGLVEGTNMLVVEADPLYRSLTRDTVGVAAVDLLLLDRDGGGGR